MWQLRTEIFLKINIIEKASILFIVAVQHYVLVTSLSCGVRMKLLVYHETMFSLPYSSNMININQ